MRGVGPIILFEGGNYLFLSEGTEYLREVINQGTAIG